MPTAYTLLPYLLKMSAHKRCHVITYNDNLLRIIVHENAKQTINQSLIPHPYKWLRLLNTFLSKARAFASRYYRISHYRSITIIRLFFLMYKFLQSY